MVAELSALQQIMNALTGMNGLPMVIVECAVTTIYTCRATYIVCPEMWLTFEAALGGFKISFITDNIQGAMVIALSRRLLHWCFSLESWLSSSNHRYRYCRSRDQDWQESYRLIWPDQTQSSWLATYLYLASRHIDERFLPVQFLDQNFCI